MRRSVNQKVSREREKRKSSMEPQSATSRRVGEKSRHKLKKIEYGLEKPREHTSLEVD